MKKKIFLLIVMLILLTCVSCQNPDITNEIVGLWDIESVSFWDHIEQKQVTLNKEEALQFSNLTCMTIEIKVDLKASLDIFNKQIEASWEIDENNTITFFDLEDELCKFEYKDNKLVSIASAGELVFIKVE